MTNGIDDVIENEVEEWFHSYDEEIELPIQTPFEHDSFILLKSYISKMTLYDIVNEFVSQYDEIDILDEECNDCLRRIEGGYFGYGGDDEPGTYTRPTLMESINSRQDLLSDHFENIIRMINVFTTKRMAHHMLRPAIRELSQSQKRELRNENKTELNKLLVIQQRLLMQGGLRLSEPVRDGLIDFITTVMNRYEKWMQMDILWKY